jgi:hypothetical protein
LNVGGWRMTCLSDLFGVNEPTFLTFAPNFHTHPKPEQKVGCLVATRPHGISGFGYRVDTRILPKKSGIGCRVSLGCNPLWLESSTPRTSENILAGNQWRTPWIATGF